MKVNKEGDIMTLKFSISEFNIDEGASVLDFCKRSVANYKDILFTTEDGVNIYKGDKYYFINLNMPDPKVNNVIGWYKDKSVPGIIRFKDKSKADEYLKRCMWKEGETYLVRFGNSIGWHVRYSSPNYSHFYINQKRNGSTMRVKEFIKSDIKLPD